MSIGRGEVGLISNGKLLDKTIWIVNQETEDQISHRKQVDMTGSVCGVEYVNTNWSLAEDGSIAICKNHEPAQTLLYEYEGTFEKNFNNGPKNFIIRNSAHYRNTGSDVRDVVVGIAGQKNWSTFPKLKEALAKLDKLDDEINNDNEAKEEANKNAEIIWKQVDEAEWLDPEETRRLKIEAEKAEKKAKRLQQKIDAARKEREAILSEASKAAAFIREQMSLRRNPVLDKSQNKAKFSNMYNGAAEIINGGPGTGKNRTENNRQ